MGLFRKLIDSEYKELKRFEKRHWQVRDDVLIYKSCRETALNKKQLRKALWKLNSWKKRTKPDDKETLSTKDSADKRQF